MNATSIQGGCFCGAVRYEASAAPVASMVCHCQSCRRLSGAPVVAWVTFAKSQFKIVRGQLAEFASNPGIRRTHCSKCGTGISYESPKFPDHIDIVTCSLDDANAYPPTHHSWLSHDLKWVRFGDALPAFPEWRPN
jgi:hypothetical protein